MSQCISHGISPSSATASPIASPVPPCIVIQTASPIASPMNLPCISPHLPSSQAGCTDALDDDAYPLVFQRIYSAFGSADVRVT